MFVRECMCSGECMYGSECTYGVFFKQVCADSFCVGGVWHPYTST